MRPYNKPLGEVPFLAVGNHVTTAVRTPLVPASTDFPISSTPLRLAQILIPDPVCVPIMCGLRRPRADGWPRRDREKPLTNESYFRVFFSSSLKEDASSSSKSVPRCVSSRCPAAKSSPYSFRSVRSNVSLRFLRIEPSSSRYRLSNPVLQGFPMTTPRDGSSTLRPDVPTYDGSAQDLSRPMRNFYQSHTSLLLRGSVLQSTSCELPQNSLPNPWLGSWNLFRPTNLRPSIWVR